MASATLVRPTTRGGGVILRPRLQVVDHEVPTAPTAAVTGPRHAVSPARENLHPAMLYLLLFLAIAATEMVLGMLDGDVQVYARAAVYAGYFVGVYTAATVTARNSR